MTDVFSIIIPDVRISLFNVRFEINEVVLITNNMTYNIGLRFYLKLPVESILKSLHTKIHLPILFDQEN